MMTQITLGVDISKARLDVYRLPDGAYKQFDNTASGFKALRKWLSDLTVAHVVYEPTGIYHRAFERDMFEAGLPLFRVNPKQARRFAESLNTLCKTDKVDAAMLAQMGMALTLRSYEPVGKVLDNMQELLRAHRALSKDKVAAKNRTELISLPLLKRQNEARLKHIDKQLKAIDTELARLLKQDKDLKDRYDILLSIPGIGPSAAFNLLISLPELGSLDNKQAAAMAGVAPMTRQSGTWNGKAMIKGGRRELRYHLYMPALVATRFNPDLKAIYDRLVAKGKPPKLAIIAAMRKLVITANACLRKMKPWQPVTA